MGGVATRPGNKGRLSAKFLGASAEGYIARTAHDRSVKKRMEKKR